MKKILWISLGVLIVGVLVMGCGQGAGEGSGEANNNESKSGGGSSLDIQDKIALRMGGASTGGTAYVYAAGLGKIIDENTNYDTQVEATAGSVENAQRIQTSELDIAVATSSVPHDAYRGLGPFEDTGPLDKVRGMLFAYPTYYQIVVPKDSDINTFEDLLGKRVSIGTPGSGVYTDNEILFKELGYTFDNIEEVNLSVSESASAFKDGSIDAAIIGGGVAPMSAIMDMASSPKGIKLISLTDEQINMLKESSPFIQEASIPANTYDGVDYDVNSAGSAIEIIVSSDLSEDVVYEIVKAVFENKEQFISAVPYANYTTEEQTAERTAQLVPLHSGTIKYLEKNGLEIAELR